MKTVRSCLKAIVLVSALVALPTFGTGCGGDSTAPEVTEGMNPTLQESLEKSAQAADETAKTAPADGSATP